MIELQITPLQISGRDLEFAMLVEAACRAQWRNCGIPSRLLIGKASDTNYASIVDANASALTPAVAASNAPVDPKA